MTIKRTKLFVLGVILFFATFVVMALGTIDVSAADLSLLPTKIDVNVKQPLILYEGNDLTPRQISNVLYYAGTKLSTFSQFRLTINGTVVATSATSTTPIQCTGFGLSSANDVVQGTLELEFASPINGETKQVVLPVQMLYNNLPIVEVSRIYVSSEKLNQFNQTSGNTALANYIRQQVSIYDVDTKPSAIGLLTYDAQAFSSFVPQKGTTVQICITVTDLNKTVTIPAYITFLNDTKAVDIEDYYKVRPISKEFYPYYLANMKTDSDGNYYAIMVDDVLYYIDNNNNVLTDANGNTFPVDACLTASAALYSGNVYKVTPLSKWVTSDNLRTLLTNCILNEDTSQYISWWKFDKEDVAAIKEAVASSGLDKNFYINYEANGYATLGTKLPNSITQEHDAKALGSSGLVWYIEDGVLYIEANPAYNSSLSYAIPDYSPSSKVSLYNGHDVFSNGNSYVDAILAFNYANSYKFKTTAPWANEEFNAVVLDNKIKRIGAYAFYGLYNITEPIEIPTDCQVIGEAAFMNCVNIPGELKTKSVNTIGAYAFANCKNMRGTLSLGSSLKTIGNAAFKNCGFVGSLSIPSSVTSIGSYAFFNCTYFTGRLMLSENITTLGSYAFANCHGFDGDINLPDKLTILQTGTFAYCYGFNGKIIFNDRLQQIREYAFYGCYNVSGNIALPNDLTSVGRGAFKDCRSLKTTLIINRNLAVIEVEAFANCPNIIIIQSPVENPALTIAPGAFTVQTGVTTLVENQFYQIEGIKIPTVVGSYNFLGDNRAVPSW